MGKARGSCYGVSLVELEGAAEPAVTRSEVTWDGTAWPKGSNLQFLMTQSRSRHSNKEGVSRALQPAKEVIYNQGLKIHE